MVPSLQQQLLLLIGTAAATNPADRCPSAVALKRACNHGPRQTSNAVGSSCLVCVRRNFPDCDGSVVNDFCSGEDGPELTQGRNTSALALAYVQQLVDETLVPKYCNATSRTVHWDVGHQNVWAECAAVQARLWALGGGKDAGLAAGAIGCAMALVAQVNATRESSFFTAPALMLAYTTLLRGSALSPAQDAAIRRFVEKTFKAVAPGSNNQHYQRAVGLLLAAQSFPAAQLAESWTGYAQAVWAAVQDDGDVTEDAPNYNRIDLTFLWVLTDLLGTHAQQQIRGPTFHAMFRRFAAQVSPSGIIPSYGDSGGANRNDPDHPWNNRWAGFVSGFLRAGAEFQDAGLTEVAGQMFMSGCTYQPLGPQYGDVADAFRLLFAVPWGSGGSATAFRSKGAKPKSSASAVLTRRDANGPAMLDKVILRSDSKGGAFLLSDLYSAEVPVPPHAHENQHGQVNWYEYDGVPLTSSLGYDNRGPADTNLLLVRPSTVGFPHRVPKFKANTWEHAVLPTKRIGENQVGITEITLRLEWDGKPIVFSAAELTLHGPSGTKPLHLFETPSIWHAPSGVRVVQIAETLPDGRNVSALQWLFPGGTKGGQAGAQFISAKVSVGFDVASYPELHVDWKISRNNDVTRTFILRLLSVPNAVDFHASELNLAPSLVNATVLTKKDDSIAKMQYNSWFSFDVELNRTVLLAGAEGVLLVRDEVNVGAAAAQRKMRAGPVWHFGPVATPVQGDDWVLSQNASVNLCVSFGYNGPDLSTANVGFQTVDVWSKERQQSAFATAMLSVGRQEHVSLLVPVRVDDLPGQLDRQPTDNLDLLRSFESSISFSNGCAMATVSWPLSRCVGSSYCGTKLQMTIDHAAIDLWAVVRSPL
eukprot:SAG31_NODE_2176_length_6256_cov_1.835797_3_plen_873_part_00